MFHLFSQIYHQSWCQSSFQLEPVKKNAQYRKYQVNVKLVNCDNQIFRQEKVVKYSNYKIQFTNNLSQQLSDIFSSKFKLHHPNVLAVIVIQQVNSTICGQ